MDSLIEAHSGNPVPYKEVTLTAVSKKLPLWLRLLKRFFLDLPVQRMAEREREKTRSSTAAAVPASPEHLQRLIVSMSEAEGCEALRYPNLSARLVTLYGEQIRPMIAPALKYGIRENELTLWTVGEPQSLRLMRSEKTPEYFLGLSDEDLLQLVDAHLRRLSGYYVMDRKFYKDFFAFMTVMLILAFLAIWSVTSKIIIWLFGAFVVLILLCWAWSCIRSRDTRTWTALYLLDVSDVARWVIITLPLQLVIFLVRWPYKAWRKRAHSAA